eukprot:3416835-Amphidinium_carterae.1
MQLAWKLHLGCWGLVEGLRLVREVLRHATVQGVHSSRTVFSSLVRHRGLGMERDVESSKQLAGSAWRCGYVHPGRALYVLAVSTRS